MKSRVIFASLVLGLGLATTQADAATTISIDDSPAANKPAGTMLVNGQEKQFAQFIGQRVNQFAHTTNWQNFMSVVSLYNQNPTAMLTISPANRVKFNEAAAQVTNQLAKQNTADASRWMNQAAHTVRMINFLWDSAQSNSEGSDIQ